MSKSSDFPANFNRPWMRFFFKDHFARTKMLSDAEKVAYLNLLGHYWDHKGLPQDDERLARIAEKPLAQWRRIKPAVARLFDPGWRLPWVDQEITETFAISDARRAAVRRRTWRPVPDGGGGGQSNDQSNANQMIDQTTNQTPIHSHSHSQSQAQKDSSREETSPEGTALSFQVGATSKEEALWRWRDPGDGGQIEVVPFDGEAR